MASERGYDQIIRMLLDAGADARWKNKYGWSATLQACRSGGLSTVQLLINHDNGLLEIVDNVGRTPLFNAIIGQHSDIVRFLLDSGADAHHVGQFGSTALMLACGRGSLEMVRLLLAGGVDVKARDKWQITALHRAADSVNIEIMRELILQHNANMFAVDEDGDTPFDWACNSEEQTADVVDNLLEIYCNKLTHDHGRLALHELLKVAIYSFVENDGFYPPLSPLRIILPLGKLTLKHFRALLHTLDPELIRNRDGSGTLPIHIACQKNCPVEVLPMLVEIDPATLHMADHGGSLPLHWCCSGAAEYSSVLYLVEQGGIGTLAARNHQGALPLHNLCGSTNPPLRAVQYLIQSFPGSVAVQTNAGQYPFIVAATDASSASLTVVYELVRANPGLVAQR